MEEYEEPIEERPWWETYDWSRYRKALRANQIANARLHEDITQTGITDFIASMTHQMQTPIVASNPEDSEGFQNLIDVFTYLRDHYDVATVREAMNVLEKRLVEPDLVNKWTTRKTTLNNLVFEPIKTGYPEYSPQIEDTRKKYGRRYGR